MRSDVWWKNFSLGLELDTSGAFIYNGLKTLDSFSVLSHSADVFEVLYNLSVGLERLFKVAIVLVEHDETTNTEDFERRLKTHSNTDLANRIEQHSSLKLAAVHREFLALLSDFYKSQRYGRYSLSAVPDIETEKEAFLGFLERHLGPEVRSDSDLIPTQNSDRIRRFVGKIVHKISRSVFDLIQVRARDLNIFTYELRPESKAQKVFQGKRLDFIDENQAKREILLHLMHPDTRGEHVEVLRSWPCLDLDPGMAPDYIRALLNDAHLSFVEGEVAELYIELENVGERFKMLALMDQDYLSMDLFDSEE